MAVVVHDDDHLTWWYLAGKHTEWPIKIAPDWLHSLYARNRSSSSRRRRLQLAMIVCHLN